MVAGVGVLAVLYWPPPPPVCCLGNFTFLLAARYYSDIVRLV